MMEFREVVGEINFDQRYLKANFGNWGKLMIKGVENDGINGRSLAYIYTAFVD